LKYDVYQYKKKLKQIQNTLIAMDYDCLPTVAICKQLVFQWIPVMLLDLAEFKRDNRRLHAETIALSLQNDDLLRQNVLLSAKLRQLP